MNEQDAKRLDRLTDRVLDIASVKTGKPSKLKVSQDSIERLTEAVNIMQESMLGSLLDRAEMQKFELAFENASDQIVITDPEGLILYANKALEKTSGYSPKQVRGKTIGDKSLWSGKMPSSFFDGIWRTIREGKTDFKGEVQNRRANGEDYISEIHVAPVLDSSQKVRYLVIIERDITEAKKLEQAKDNFLSIASHELQTPLTAIHWHVEMIKSQDFGPLNAQQTEFVQTIEQITKQLSGLVKMLLNTSRIDVGSVAIKPEPMNLKSVIETVITEIQGSIKERKITVKQRYPAKIRAIPLDKNLIYVALTNLFANAVKYNKEKGTISVSVEATKAAYRVRISDTGMGIPANQQDRIFSRMFRADNARMANIQGSGLGLYITKWIIESAGGTIGFTSTMNKGSTFIFTIPFTGMTLRKGTKTLE